MTQTVQWSAVSDPSSWDAMDALPFKFASDEDATAAARWFNEYRESLVRHCAKVCETLAKAEFSTQRFDRTDRAMTACSSAILREFGLEPEGK